MHAHVLRTLWLAVLLAATAIVAALVVDICADKKSGDNNPLISQDHWHAVYEFIACGERQPNAPTWEGVGVHTHGDGVIHIHPFIQTEEGAGARLVKWFDYGGGRLTDDEVRLPGLSTTWHNGDVCPDGTADAGSVGRVQVFANGEAVDIGTYLPEDGDKVRIVFGPPDSGEFGVPAAALPTNPTPRPSTSADITIEMQDNVFVPASITVPAGEPFGLLLFNAGVFVHNLRIAGPDGEFETDDDIVGEDVGAGAFVELVATITEPGEYPARDDYHPEMTLTIVAE